MAPGLLRALHGLKEMHAAAGLAVMMTATEDGNGAGRGGGKNNDGSSLTLRAELGVMGLLDAPLFEAMSEAVPGFEDLTPSIIRDAERRGEAGGGSGDEGSGSSSSSGSGSSAPAASSPDTSAGTTTPAGKAKPRSGLELSALDMDSFKEAVVAAQSKSGVFSGKYQVLAVRFTGGVLVRTFAKSAVASLLPRRRRERGGRREERESERCCLLFCSSSSPCSYKPTTTLTLVRELLDKRPHLWRFVRGPLPEGLPVRQLALPWTLLSIDLD